jgi:hypothetical protein
MVEDRPDPPAKKHRPEPKTPVEEKASKSSKTSKASVPKQGAKKTGTGAKQQRKDSNFSSSPSGESRRSARATNRPSYAEADDEDEDVQMGEEFVEVADSSEEKDESDAGDEEAVAEDEEEEEEEGANSEEESAPPPKGRPRSSKLRLDVDTRGSSAKQPRRSLRSQPARHEHEVDDPS